MTLTPLPLPGDFGVVKTHGGKLLDRLAAEAICWGTNSPVDHAFVYVGGGRIVEAVRHVRYNTVDAYPGAIWSTGSVALTDAQRDTIFTAAETFVGLPYNILDIAAIALAQNRLGHLVDGDEWWVKRLSDPTHLICSQLVDQAYLQAGIHLFSDGRLPGLVSPGDLYTYIEEHRAG